MKKTLGVLVLSLLSLAVTAACASSGASSTPKSPQPDSEGHDDSSGEARLRMNSAKAGPLELASLPGKATVQTAGLVSR